MVRVLLASTALGVLITGGPALAQGIALFGDARLGLGYNIDNDGGVLVEDGKTPDDVRAVSRVQFGVNMTGETEAGITFGASIRADNAEGGEGGTEGQTEGDVFVSGAWGTLTFGDTNGADEQWVGDVPGNYSLTGLTDINETKYISNGGSFGESNGNHFAENPVARPTVRYDFDYQGFGFSLSSNRDLSDIGVGAGYAADFGGGSWSIGAGYYKYDTFVAVGDTAYEVVDDAVVAYEPTTVVPGGEQWSIGLNATYSTLELGVTYSKINSDDDGFGQADAENLLIGGSYTFDAWSVGAFYGKILDASADDDTDSFNQLDGGDAYGLTAQYDLGGGATVNAGIVQSFPEASLNYDQATIADFGISMAF